MCCFNDFEVFNCGRIFPGTFLKGGSCCVCKLVIIYLLHRLLLYCACSHMVVVVTLPDQEECLTNASVCVCQ